MIFHPQFDAPATHPPVQILYLRLPQQHKLSTIQKQKFPLQSLQRLNGASPFAKKFSSSAPKKHKNQSVVFQVFKLHQHDQYTNHKSLCFIHVLVQHLLSHNHCLLHRFSIRSTGVNTATHETLHMCASK